MSARNILYYACGGGLGHVTRCWGIARQVARLLQQNVNANDSVKQTLFTNSPYASVVRDSGSQHQLTGAIDWCQIPLEVSPAQSEHRIRQLVTDLQPDVIVVDTFPRGLGGEWARIWQNLPSGDRPWRVLISRTLPDDYKDACRLGEFVDLHYQAILGTGEPWGVGPGDLPSDTRAAVIPGKPMIVCDPDQLLPMSESAAVLNCHLDRPVLLLVGSGNLAECQQMVQLAAALTPRLSPEVQIRVAIPDWTGLHSDQGVHHWPIVETFRAVDMVVGSAGYNLYWECQTLRIPHCLMARPRKYDQQNLRADTERYREDTELQDWVLRICQQWETLSSDKQQRPFLYENGTAVAARYLCSCIQGVPKSPIRQGNR